MTQRIELNRHGSALYQSTCPVCRGSRVGPLTVTRGHAVYQCGECGLRFLAMQPDDATLEAIYTADYFLGEKTVQSETRVAELKRATGALYLDLLISHLGRSNGHLLEIGCGKGDLLVEAQARGLEVTGIEISAHAASVANCRLDGDRVLVGTLDSVQLPEGAFDAVVFADVIEHVRDPLDFLCRVHALLKPGGLALLVTPSLDSWSARLMGRYWMEYKAEHLFYFGERSIRLALARAGFARVVTMPNVKVLSFDYVYRHFLRFPVPVITPLLRLARRLVPETLAHRQVRVVASGLVAMGRKADDCPLA